VTKTFEYSGEFLEPLLIYSNPKCTDESLTDYSYSPGSKFQVSAEWTVSSEPMNDGGGGEGEEDDSIVFTYLKLRDGRGWVEMYHPVTGGRLLKEISR
jgi:hypothetical protein